MRGGADRSNQGSQEQGALIYLPVVSVHMHVCVHSNCVWWTVKWRVNLQRLHLTATSICFSHSLSHPALQQSCIPAGKIPSLLISKGPDTQRHPLAFERLHMIQEEKRAGSSTALTLYDRQTELHEALQYMALTVHYIIRDMMQWNYYLCFEGMFFFLLSNLSVTLISFS